MDAADMAERRAMPVSRRRLEVDRPSKEPRPGVCLRWRGSMWEVVMTDPETVWLVHIGKV